MPACPARLLAARPWSARLRRPVPRAQARTRASPHARSPCCLAHCAPGRQARDPGAGDGDEGDGGAR
eukprot:4884742-Prymnesium_polylepis.1